MENQSSNNEREREELESLLIDYIDGALNDEDRVRVEQLLVNQPKANKRYQQLKEVIGAMKDAKALEPSGRMRHAFAETLKQEERALPAGRSIRMYPVFYRAAAAVLLVVVGGGIGYWISRQHLRESEMEAMRREMAATKQMLMTMLDNQQSASQRVLGATVAFNDVEQVDDDITNALLRALNNDENTNVRMAALEALEKFYQQPHVRKALVASLNQQDDPVVQIALIRLMIEMKEKGIAPELERITDDENALPAVKDEAHAGLLKLL